jgi:hypothetical protein
VLGYEASFEDTLNIERGIVGHGPTGCGFEVRGSDQKHVGDWRVISALVRGVLVRAVEAALLGCEAMGLKTRLGHRLGDDSAVENPASWSVTIMERCISPPVFERGFGHGLAQSLLGGQETSI